MRVLGWSVLLADPTFSADPTDWLVSSATQAALSLADPGVELSLISQL